MSFKATRKHEVNHNLAPTGCYEEFSTLSGFAHSIPMRLSGVLDGEAFGEEHRYVGVGIVAGGCQEVANHNATDTAVEHPAG